MRRIEHDRTGQSLTALFESWSREFAAKIDRVFDLIGGVHHGELGANREGLFRDFLRSYLPGSCTVSTGFVLGENNQVTGQQDVIVWDSTNHMPYMREGEFVVVPQESVMALIEVKSNLSGPELKKALKQLHAPMFRNSRLAEPNPSDPNAGQQTVDVPFRGILALRGTSGSPHNCPVEVF